MLLSEIAQKHSFLLQKIHICVFCEQVTVVCPYGSGGPSKPNLREIIFKDGDTSKITANFSSNMWVKSKV
jgi:hypothetical protein